MQMVVVGALALAACEAGAPKADCAGAAAGVFKLDASAAKDAVAKRCLEDKWSVEAAICLRDATSSDAHEQCRYRHLTREQDDKLEAAMWLDSAAAVMRKLEEFSNKICACKNADCAKDVSGEMTRWSQEMAAKTKRPPKMTEADQKRATEIGTRMGECMQKAMEMGGSYDSQRGGAHGNGNVGGELRVTGIEPNRGDIEGGTYVRLQGTGFTADGPRNAKVYFGSRQGTVVRFASDSELIVEAPGGKENETVDVLVIFEPGGELKIPKGFTFTHRIPN